jgi:hypothetical protein
MPNKLTDLEITENSGVDHPAHLVEGWLVMKNLEAVIDEAQQAAVETDNGGTVDESTHVSEEVDETVEVEVIEIAEEAVEAPVLEPVMASVDDESVSVESEALAKELVDLRKEAEEAKSLAKALMDERDTNAAVAKATTWNYIPAVTPDEFGPTLKSLRQIAPEIAEQIEKMLDSINAMLSESEFFTELGSAGRSQTDAHSSLDRAAKALVADGGAANYADAVSKASASDPVLAAQYRNEIGGRR